jgi:hypothetical protein
VTAVYWASCIAMWIASIIAGSVLYHYRRRLLTQTANMRAAGDPDGITAWATWTMLTVTDREGNISAWTLRQIYDSRMTDRLFIEPSSVELWHYDPATVRTQQDTADGLMNLRPMPGDTPEPHGG